MASDKEGKDAWINDLIDMFSDLVLVVCPASPVLVRRESNRREALNITKKRAKNFKRTLLLIDEKDKKFFEQLPNQPGIKVCVVPKPSKLPSEAAEYISVLAGSAVCNVFFDDSFVPEIESLRRELFAVYPNKADAVRWFDLSTLGGSSLTHCAMLTCAGQPPPLRENIYLISEAFMSLASDKEGDPQQSSIAALFPRLVAYRTDERAKQSFMFVKDSAGRILNDKQQRDKLTNYWRYAEPLLYTNTADLKTRIESMFFNFND